MRTCKLFFKLTVCKLTSCHVQYNCTNCNVCTDSLSAVPHVFSVHVLTCIDTVTVCAVIASADRRSDPFAISVSLARRARLATCRAVSKAGHKFRRSPLRLIGSQRSSSDNERHGRGEVAKAHLRPLPACTYPQVSHQPSSCLRYKSQWQRQQRELRWQHDNPCATPSLNETHQQKSVDIQVPCGHIRRGTKTSYKVATPQWDIRLLVKQVSSSQYH